jgi:hypothetical protein
LGPVAPYERVIIYEFVVLGAGMLIMFAEKVVPRTLGK